jgi:hypothetical protein
VKWLRLEHHSGAFIFKAMISGGGVGRYVR